MAKKTEQFDFEDDSFWKELDESSSSTGGFADGTQKAGRRKAVTDFAGSFLSGVKKTLLDPSNQRKFLADNMPDGYAAAFDAASMGAQGIKDIYRSTKDEIDKNLVDMAKDADTLNKHYGKVLPKRLRDKITEKLENANTATYRAPTEEEALNEDLNSVFAELADVQRSAALANQQTSETTTNRIIASQNTNTAAVSVSNRILSNISGSNEKLVGLGFTSGKLARKQIELTFKSYVIQRQMLDTLQQTKDMQEKAFKSLIQNTGLPEAVKITNWELASKSLKQKMVGMATERMSASFAPTGSLIMGRIKENFTNKASMAGGGMGLLMSMLAMQADMGDMGESKSSMAGDAAGQVGGNLLQWYMRKKLGDKYKNDPRFKTMGDGAMNFMDSFPGTFNKLQNNFGGFSRIMHALGVGDILTPDSSLKTRVRGSAHKHFDEVVSFNKKSEIALTEVIPGWLGKVHHQLKIMATGNADAEEERYDYEKSVFTTKNDLAKQAHSQMFNKTGMKDSKAKAEQIVNSLDKKGELTKKERQVLMRYVLQQANADTGFIDPAALMDTVDSPLNKFDPKAAKRIAAVLSNEHNFNHTADGGYDSMSDKSLLFGNVNKNSQYQASMRGSNDLLKELRRVMPNSKNVALREANVGNIDILREMGAVVWDNNNKEWKFDNDKLFNGIMGGGKGGSSSPGGSPRPGGGGSPYKPPSFGGGAPTQPSPNPFNGGPFGGEAAGGGYTPFQQELLETIERTSSKASVDVSSQILESIRQRLEMGVPQGGEAATPQQQDRKSGWFRKMLSGSMQSTGKGLKNYFKFATVKAPTAVFRAFVQTPMRIISGVTDLPGRILRRGRGAMKVVDSSSKKFGESLGDLYVKGREGAVIKLQDLKAGRYFDASTKKVIKSFKDIKGAVIDKDGKEIISEEEVKGGLYTIVNGKSFSIIGGMLRAGFSTLSSIAKANFAGISMVTGAGKKAFGAAKAIYGMMGGTPDVYVQGETSPRLLSRIMRAGGYFNKDGSVIKTVNDIRGTVVDNAGDVILDVADIAKGLVDKRGRPFKSLKDKLKGIVMAPVKMMGKAVRGVWKMATLPFKLMKKGSVGIMNFFKSKKDASPEQVLQAGTMDAINRIYGLLDERMPRPKGSWNDRDGSGFRDGSREDVLSSRGKDTPQAKEAADKDDSKKDRKGILGLLLGIAGGIGGLIGTVKGWAKNIFALMRLATQTKLAGSAMDLAGGLLGGGKGGGKGGRLKSIFRGARNFITKSKIGKYLTAGAIVAGAIGFSKSSYGSDTIRGVTDAINGSGSAAEKAAMGEGDMGSSPSEGGGGSGGGSGGPSLTQRMLTGAGGSILGEMGAIAAFPAAAALYQKLQGTKAGSKILPTFRADKSAPATSKSGKLIEFFTKSKKGRLIAAGLVGGGLVGGQNLLMGNGGDDLGAETTSSMRNSLLMDLAAATAVPIGLAKGKQWYDARKAAKAAKAMPKFSAMGAGPAAGTSGVFKPGVAPTLGRAPMVGPQMPAGAPAMTPTAAKSGIGSKLMGAGKGVFRNAGLLGTGFAAYDALTTEGTMWDKTKAFGSSLLSSAAVGKGLSMGGKLFSAAGRQGLMQGARTAASFVGRQALMQGARTGAIALASTLGAPVVLGGLAALAVGYGAWKGYKYFFGTDKNAIVRFRMAQYGFDLDDKEKATIIGQFEQICQKNAVVDNSGKAYFKKNVSAAEIFKLFGIPEEDKERINNFITWFGSRFKPVFLKAFAFYKAKTKKTTLEKADSLPKPDKLAMLNAMGGVGGSPSPYSISVTPFTDGKKLKYDAAGVKSELQRALRNVGHEKGPGEKGFKDKAKDFMSKSWDAAKEGLSKLNNMRQTAVDVAASVVKNVAKLGVDQVKNTIDLGKNVATGNWKGAWGNVKQYGSNVANTAGNIAYDASAVVKMSGTQKEWQLRVYKAFKSAAFSEQQARILTAEIGRENSYNPKYLFGGHADPHSGSNLGMLSWQGDRKTKLKGFLQNAGVVDARGNIVPGQKALDAQAQFIMWELKNTHKKVGSKFLASPNISYKDGSYLIGKHYILWRIDDPKYAAGKKNRDGFYNMLLKQLGAKDGDGKSSVTAAQSGSTSATPLASNAVPSAAAGQQKPASSGGSSGGGSGGGGGGGWFGYMAGGGSRPINASDTAGGGYGGGTDLVAAAKSGAVVTSGSAGAFIKSIDPKLIALGQSKTKLADKGVDVAGMVKGFMIIFYGMIGEAVQRGVLGSVLVNSANRSMEKQKALYDAYIRDPKRNPMAAKPGGSRHNYGIAIDINSDHANKLAAAGLLSKYGFTRPLLNHPKKPEAWHLESEYFKRGSGNTVTEVAKATKDSGNKAKVEKAKKDEAKANPIVKAENQIKNTTPAKPKTQIPMKPVDTSSAEAKLKSMSSGFMGGGSTAWGGADRSTAPTIENPVSPVNKYLDKATTSTTSVASAQVTQNQQRADMESATEAMLNVQTQQLQIQQEMVGVLHEIRDTLQTVGIKGAAEAPAAAPAPTNTSANRAAEMIRAKSRDIPVSMSINR